MPVGEQRKLAEARATLEELKKSMRAITASLED
jgi:hypothetical protein